MNSRDQKPLTSGRGVVTNTRINRAAYFLGTVVGLLWYPAAFAALALAMWLLARWVWS
jgi:hypothetical protein